MGAQRKLKCWKEQERKCDPTENNINVASGPNYNFFFNTIQAVSLDIIKSWSVTCLSTLESLQKLEFEVNNDVNSNVFLCQGDITKLNVDTIVNSVNKALIGGGGIGGAIHEAAGPRFLKCQQLNGCETGECKITWMWM